MKVESVHSVRGRGIVAVVQRSDESAAVLVGTHLSNGERVWRVTGVETATTLMLPPRPIGPIGLVLSGDVPPVVGDDLQIAGVAPSAYALVSDLRANGIAESNYSNTRIPRILERASRFVQQATRRYSFPF